MDCTRSPELLFPFPRNLGVLPQELIVLTKVVDHLKAKRVVEIWHCGRAHGAEYCPHLPPGGEIITLDLPRFPARTKFGFFYWINRPKQNQTDLRQRGLLGLPALSRFCRARLLAMPATACRGLPRKPIRLFPVVKPGGVILRHDYSTAEGPTRFWEWLARELPVFQIEGTVMLCLRVDSEEVYKKRRRYSSTPF